jgi:peptidoglycan/LPS O-acetylase OafA/YrhL
MATLEPGTEPAMTNDPTPSTNPRAAIAGPHHHITALDGLRGLAVLLVLVFHIFQVESEPASGALRLAYKATRIGQTGVDLFFVLSGFLITGILADTRGSRAYFHNFYGRRTVRIFPLYYGVLIVATIILPLGLGGPVTDANPWCLWTYTANMPAVFHAEPVTFGHFWTLAVEEQFYLIWPAVVFACARPTMMRVCVGCIVGSIFVRIGLVRMGLSPNSFMPGRLDSLAAGGLLALAARGPSGTSGWRRRAWLTLGAMAVVVLPLYVVKTGSHEGWLQVIKFTLLAGLYAALLALTVVSSETSPLGRFFGHPAMRFFGKYSYGIYVFHPLWIDAFRTPDALDSLSRFGDGRAVAVRFAAIVVLSVASAWLSWHFFEKHFLRLKKYFIYETRPAAPEPVGALPGARGLAIEG